MSRSSISRHLAKAGLLAPEPRKRPKSSYRRFAAAMPNDCWQSHFTHYRLTRPAGRAGHTHDRLREDKIDKSATVPCASPAGSTT